MKAVVRATYVLVFSAFMLCGCFEERQYIRIVGSSSLYSFAISVAESFVRQTTNRAPIIESTGTGAGMHLFCQGVGEKTPDIVLASRPMTLLEVERCRTNGVNDVHKLKIGFDGIVLGQGLSSQPITLNHKHIYLALAKYIEKNGQLAPNPYTLWSDIDKSLPHEKIRIMGPSDSSGTYETLDHLIMSRNCAGKAPKCREIRREGIYVESGGNENLIIQKLNIDHRSVGIITFRFLSQNIQKLRPISVEGYRPKASSIMSGAYPISRVLYVYVKGEHLGVIPGIKAFMKEFLSERSVGPFGYLIRKGLVPLPSKLLKVNREKIESLRANS